MTTVGTNIPHDSARGHVSGESIYIDDMAPLKGELLVDFFFSPVAHGRIVSLDVSAVADVPGVAGVFTHRDLPHNHFGPIIIDELLLAEDTVTFIGQPIVVIAAETREALRLAKAAVKIDIEKLPPIFTIEEAMEAKQFIGPTRYIRRGDLEAGFAAADHVLEGVWVNGGQDHFYLEGQAALVVPGEYDTLTVHSSTQNPTEVQHIIADLLDVPMNKVVVITKRMGGGFGGKECQATHPAAMAALVAQQLKRPARIVYNKDDDMRVTGGRHPFRNLYKVGFRNDGTLTALKADLYSDGGAFADLSTSVMGRAMTHIDNAYYVPAADITGTVCRTNRPPNTAFRGFGGPQGVITMENIMEEIATLLGLDPLEVRTRNAYGIGERDITPYGQQIKNNTLPTLFRESRVRANWDARVAEVRAFNERSKTHLRGIASSAVKFGISFNTKFLNQGNALVNVYVDGSVQVSTGATEMGQGVNTKIKQVVADEFGISIDRVIAMPTSTEKNNNTSATAASSGADLNGGAAIDACRKIRGRMAEVAADYFARAGVTPPPSPESLVFANNVVTCEGASCEPLPFPALTKMCHLARVALGDRGFYATEHLEWNADTGCGTPFLYFTKGVSISEVEIDRFTGHLTVLRSDVLMDIGRPINPGIDRGQLTGAFIQGMGWLTNEELRWTPEGELLTHSPTTYKIPNIQDVPAVFNVDWIENNDNQLNVRGSKAVGEPPLLMAISVWMAVKNALTFLNGGKIPKLHAPATGEEILMRMTEVMAGKLEAEAVSS